MTMDTSLKPLEDSKLCSEPILCQRVVSIITPRLEIKCYITKHVNTQLNSPTENIAGSLLTHIVPLCKLKKDAPPSRPNPKLAFLA